MFITILSMLICDVYTNIDSVSSPNECSFVTFADSTLILKVTPRPYLTFEIDNTLEKGIEEYSDEMTRNILEEMRIEENVFNRLLDFFMMLEYANHSLTDSLLREVNATLYNYEGNAIAGYKYKGR